MFSKLIKLSILFVLLLAGYNTASASFTISRPSTHNLGLVGHWTFDGKNVVSGVALDSSGSGNNGNLKNIATSTFYSYGKIGQGFNFDGADDHVRVPSSIAFDFASTGGFSYFAWFKKEGTCSSAQGNEVFTSRFGTDHEVRTWWFGCRDTAGTNPNKLIINVLQGTGNQVSVTSNTAINDGAWHYGGWVYDGSANQLSLYLDGVLQNASTTAFTGSFNVANPVCIGSYGTNCNGKNDDGGAYEYDGSFDEVRVYNRALSAGEIKNLYNQGVSKFNKTPTNILTNGLVGHWTFDGKNVVNGVALDSSGSGNNGNLKNIATSTFYSTGKIGQGFNFDGSNDYVNIGTPASLTNIAVKTISAWIYPTNLSGTGSRRVVDKEDGGEGWFFGVQSTNDSVMYLQHFSGAGSIPNWTSPASSIIANQWQHIAITYDRTSTTNDPVMYINGVSQSLSESAAPVGTADSDAPLRMGLGGGASASSMFPGIIDDVRIYNRALSAGEIKMLYNMGR